jgi:hypothetical protein
MLNAAVTANRESVLNSLDSLLSTMDLEADELKAKQKLESGFESQLESMERQRRVVSDLMDDHVKNEDELVSKFVTDAFWNLLVESTDRWNIRNDRMLGLYRSAGSMIMKKDWDLRGDSTSDWVESFQRSIARKRKEVLGESTNNNRLVKLSHLTTLQIEEELYRDSEYRAAPKEYWRQYAAFKLMGSVLVSRKSSLDLAAEMSPAFDVLRLAVG